MLNFVDSASFSPYTKVEKRRRFLVTNVPRFDSKEDSDYISLPAEILPIGLEVMSSDFVVPFCCLCLIFGVFFK